MLSWVLPLDIEHLWGFLSLSCIVYLWNINIDGAKVSSWYKSNLSVTGSTRTCLSYLVPRLQNLFILAMIMRNMTNMATKKPCIHLQFLFNLATHSNYNYLTTEPVVTCILVAHNIHFYLRITWQCFKSRPFTLSDFLLKTWTTTLY